MVAAQIFVQQSADAGAGCPHERKRNLLQSRNRYPAVVELGCRFQNLRSIRRRYMEGQKEFDVDLGPPLRRQRQSLVEEPVDGLWKFLSGHWNDSARASGQWICEGYSQRSAALSKQFVQSPNWSGMGSNRHRRLGHSRWLRDL